MAYEPTFEIVGINDLGTKKKVTISAMNEEMARSKCKKHGFVKIESIRKVAKDAEPTHEEIVKKFDATINKYISEGKKEEASRMMAEKAKALAALSRSKGNDSVSIRAKSAADAWNGQNAQAPKVEVKDVAKGKIIKVHSYKGFKIKEYDTESSQGNKFEVFNKEGQEEWGCDQMFEAKQFIDSY
jgi:hypothetical protein